MTTKTAAKVLESIGMVSSATLQNHKRNLYIIFIAVTTSPPSYYATTTTSPREELPPWSENYDENQIIVHHAPPTMEPFPTVAVATHRPQVIYENYDTKYNVYDSEPEPKNPEDSLGSGGSGGGFRISEAATQGTVLVIGIIAGALIAVILIVIIVLKMRTRVEGNFKVDTNGSENRTTYQFQQQQNVDLLTPLNGASSAPVNNVAAAAAGPADDFETPSIVGISNLPGTKATVIPASNGFYEKYVNNNQKKNANGKPVREWYV